MVVTLQSATGRERAEQQLVGTDADALRALVLAEVRRAPLAVWKALAQALESHTGRAVDATAALRSADELLDAGGDGWVSFRDERVAESLRHATDPDVVRAVSLAFVDWLRNQPATGATGRYRAQGLAMHAVQAGQFDSVQRSGRLAAHLDQVALIDAAHVTGRMGVLAAPHEHGTRRPGDRRRHRRLRTATPVASALGALAATGGAERDVHPARPFGPAPRRP
ncbi:hypothetical protein J7F01_33925 [Streptomyces sp. ISL-22]|uniref:hypothetical protein n=1 Tax=unclassified Streptomyces TaxID=2593676 RepID=UPI001BEB5F13|nr:MULTISPECIES: hypothetical protein [unclassified Streptomyces]MBT2421254.1 hypothetical protein [Streptomyces sp. ISL-24]MBT2437071.1 hypothetical protein [Streptomyces sp. ISL-22]